MHSSSTARVLIAHSHNLFREGLQHILQNENDVEIVGDAVNGIQIISVINELKPDIVLHGMNVPGMETLQIIPAIKSKEIANKLFISEKTVKSHMNNIFKKFDVSGRIKAIVYAIKHGLC